MTGPVSVYDLYLQGPAAPLVHGRSASLKGLAPENSQVTIERVGAGAVATVQAGPDGSFAAPSPRSRAVPGACGRPCQRTCPRHRPSEGLDQGAPLAEHRDCHRRHDSGAARRHGRPREAAPRRLGARGDEASEHTLEGRLPHDRLERRDEIPRPPHEGRARLRARRQPVRLGPALTPIPFSPLLRPRGKCLTQGLPQSGGDMPRSRIHRRLATVLAAFLVVGVAAGGAQAAETVRTIGGPTFERNGFIADSQRFSPGNIVVRPNERSRGSIETGLATRTRSRSSTGVNGRTSEPGVRLSRLLARECPSRGSERSEPGNRAGLGSTWADRA